MRAEVIRNHFFTLQSKFQNNFWIGLTVLTKALTQMVILKSISFHFGSSGVGYLGQVLGCVTILNSLLSVGLVNFLVTELSKTEADTARREQIYRSVAFWCFSFQVLLIALSAFLANTFSILVFNDESEKVFFIALAVGFIFFNMSSITQGFLASRKQVKTIFISTITSSVLSLAAFVAVTFNHESAIPEAALAFYFIQGIVLFSFFIKSEASYKSLFSPLYNPEFVKKIIRFTSVMSVTGALGAFQQVFMRKYLIDQLGLTWTDVGHWQAVLKISEINLSFIGLTMISLYLPSISVTKTSAELRLISTKYLRQVLFLVSAVLLAIVVCAKYVLLIIYSKDFTFLENLLRIQMFGDIFKLCSWIFTYFILAKLSIGLFLLVEVSGLILLTLMSVLLANYYKIDGLIYAQALTSLIFFGFTFLIYNYYSKRDSKWDK